MGVKDWFLEALLLSGSRYLVGARPAVLTTGTARAVSITVYWANYMLIMCIAEDVNNVYYMFNFMILETRTAYLQESASLKLHSDPCLLFHLSYLPSFPEAVPFEIRLNPQCKVELSHTVAFVRFDGSGLHFATLQQDSTIWTVFVNSGWTVQIADMYKEHIRIDNEDSWSFR